MCETRAALVGAACAAQGGAEAGGARLGAGGAAPAVAAALLRDGEQTLQREAGGG